MAHRPRPILARFLAGWPRHYDDTDGDYDGNNEEIENTPSCPRLVETGQNRSQGSTEVHVTRF